jgi:hypothetical protein
MCAECHSSLDATGKHHPGEAIHGCTDPFRSPWPNDWAIQAPRNGGLPGYSEELAIRLLTKGAIDRARSEATHSGGAISRTVKPRLGVGSTRNS